MSKSVQRGGKTTAPKKTAAKPKSAAKRASTPALSRDKQIALYEKAMKLFSSGDFAKAKSALETVATGPNTEIAHTARTHSAACDRRLARNEPNIKTPVEHYDYAVALINQRQAGEAEKHLREALAGLSDADYVHYGLAIVCGWQGKLSEAASHLATAIRLEPKNRSIARNDPDFEPFASAPEISELLRTGRGGAA